MCDSNLLRAKGWQGWIELPPARATTPVGPWVDLSHRVGPNMPCASIFPKPRFQKLKSLPDDPFNVTEMCTVVHAGTHLDAPSHFLADAPAFHEIPLDRMMGPGVVWTIDCVADQVIDVADLEACEPMLMAGDILALDTGWAARFGTDAYETHPSLSTAAAEWLLAKKIKLLACDFATPDLVYHLRAPGFAWPVHHTLLSHGILVCEHITGHSVFANKRVEFIFGALSIEHSDGAPARVLGRLIAD
jgi:kynurenine formamidase